MITGLAELLTDKEDSITLILTKSGEGFSVTVIPKTKAVPHERTVPLVLRGPLKELEAGIAQAIKSYSGGHLSIAEQVELTAKAQQAQAAEAAAKAKEKAGAKGKTTTDAKGKAEAKTEPPKSESPAPAPAPSLWDQEDEGQEQATQTA